MPLTDSYEVAGSREQRALHHAPKSKPNDIQGYLSTNSNSSLLHYLYHQGFAHSPRLSLFRVHWKERMSHNSGSSWLIFTKKQLHSISFCSPSFLRHPMSQIPLFHLVVLSVVERWMLSVSVQPFPDSPAPGISLSHRQHSRVPHSFWI